MQTPLNSVVFGKSVVTIGTFAFWYTKLTALQIPDSVVEIGHWAFSNNPSLDSLIFGKSVKIIRKWAFATTAISSVTLPDSLKLIEAGAFEGNFNLGRISIPDSIEILEEDVFARDYALKTIEYCGIARTFPITPVCPIERQAVIDAKKLAEALAAAELKAKQEAEALAAAELKAKQEADKKASLLKKTTITCIKGKLTKKITAVKPKCPAGYKKK